MNCVCVWRDADGSFCLLTTRLPLFMIHLTCWHNSANTETHKHTHTHRDTHTERHTHSSLLSWIIIVLCLSGAAAIHLAVINAPLFSILSLSSTPLSLSVPLSLCVCICVCSTQSGHSQLITIKASAYPRSPTAEKIRQPGYTHTRSKEWKHSHTHPHIHTHTFSIVFCEAASLIIVSNWGEKKVSKREEGEQKRNWENKWVSIASMCVYS